MSDEAQIYPSDDTPEGVGPDLEILGAPNGDWYVCVREFEEPECGLYRASAGVRFATSGGRDDVAVMLVAALHAALDGDDGAVRDRCHAAVSLLTCGRRL